MKKFLEVHLIVIAGLMVCFIIYPILTSACYGQTSEVIIPSNSSTGSLEKNMLFHADKRFTVSQSGAGTLYLPMMFDGAFNPSLSSNSIQEEDPTVILIEDFTVIHSLAGAWVGWSSRYLYPIKFKIEAFNATSGVNQWVTVADISNYTSNQYMVPLPGISVGKLRFTFYEATGTNGKMQLSELFYIHPEGAKAYDGLMVQYDKNMNVGIGTTTPDSKLSVNGNIRAHEIKLETSNWPDYVFEEGYQQMSLEDVEAFIAEHSHLPGLKSAEVYKEEGVDMMELNQKLLEKIEELTLYILAQDKTNKTLQSKVEQLNLRTLRHEEMLIKADKLEEELQELKKLLNEKL